jgi:hypothetical protein
MPSEVTRFRLARVPQRVCTDNPRRPPLRLADWLEGSELIDRLGGEEPAARPQVAADLAGERLSRAVTSVAEFEVPWPVNCRTLMSNCGAGITSQILTPRVGW